MIDVSCQHPFSIVEIVGRAVPECDEAVVLWRAFDDPHTALGIDDGVVGHVSYYHRIGTDPDIVPHPHLADDLGPGTDIDVVAQRRRAEASGSGQRV
jgi:hypothetical protein